VHPCGVAELLIDPLPAAAAREGALYPDGARLTDLKQVRDLLYTMQRPAIAPPVRPPLLPYPYPPSLTHIAPPQLVYPHNWYAGPPIF
jgi:hypothetical protein